MAQQEEGEAGLQVGLPEPELEASAIVLVINLKEQCPCGSDESWKTSTSKHGDEFSGSTGRSRDECSKSSSSSSRNEEIVQLSDEPPQRVCRVCHLGSPEVISEFMELDCVCKDDLAIAHRKCAEAWFKIRGNRKCEICGNTVTNIVLKRGVWKRMLGVEVEFRGSHRQPLCNVLATIISLMLLLPLIFRLNIFK